MTRIFTGIGLVALLFAGLILGGWFWVGFIMLIVLFASWEFADIFFKGRLLALKLIVVLGGLIFPLNKYMTINGLYSLSEGFLFAMLFVLTPTLYMISKGTIEEFIINVPMAIIGPLWSGYLISYTVPLYYMRIEGVNEGIALVFLLAMLVTGNDIGAYYFGRMFGKTPLSPVFSPNKTWEGAAGGLGLALFNGILAHYTFLPTIGMQHVIALSIIVVIAGDYGDLFESVFKRSCNVKDAGGILPGHGGIFDRLDSFAFATPVFYFYLFYFVAS